MMKDKKKNQGAEPKNSSEKSIVQASNPSQNKVQDDERTRNTALQQTPQTERTFDEGSFLIQSAPYDITAKM